MVVQGGEGGVGTPSVVKSLFKLWVMLGFDGVIAPDGRGDGDEVVWLESEFDTE